MHIRNYEPGDEAAQARIYNTAAGALPKFKPATAEEIARRYRVPGFSPDTRFYAVDGGEVVGYMSFDPNGRVSCPWHLPGKDRIAGPLLDTVISTMCELGLPRAWAAYRADWTDVIGLLDDHGFSLECEMINFVAELSALPRDPLPEGYEVGPLQRESLPELLALRGELVLPDDTAFLGDFFWENPFFAPESLFGLRRRDDDPLLGAALTIIDPAFAEPTKIDAGMPCFRLGAMGTERERHKRVNGLFSASFSTSHAGAMLLAEAARRMASSGLAHAAAQARSDESELVSFYDRYFQRQGAFPIMSCKLD